MESTSFIASMSLRILLFGVLIFTGCDSEKGKKTRNKKSGWEVEFENYGDTLVVTASAYNLTPAQTVSNPSLGAWADTLKPDDKVIAISQDLLQKGLSHNAKVKIEGFSGYYRVRDKMHSRWENRIDIMMGDSIQKAEEFGVQKTKIYYINSDKRNHDQQGE